LNIQNHEESSVYHHLLKAHEITTNAITQQAIRDDILKAQKDAQNTELEIQEKASTGILQAQKQADNAISNSQETAKSTTSVLNHVDELRYLLLASQVEIVDDPAKIADVKYTATTEDWTIGVINADGEKCDRCWNYSTHVGESEEHPLLCERCVPALAGEF
jgi:isoleucyl-tRNA synthetase